MRHRRVGRCPRGRPLGRWLRGRRRFAHAGSTRSARRRAVYRIDRRAPRDSDHRSGSSGGELPPRRGPRPDGRPEPRHLGAQEGQRVFGVRGPGRPDAHLHAPHPSATSRNPSVRPTASSRSTRNVWRPCSSAPRRTSASTASMARSRTPSASSSSRPTTIRTAWSHATVLFEMGRGEEAEAAHNLVKEMGEASGDPATAPRACIAPALFVKDFYKDMDRAEALYLDCIQKYPTDGFLINHVMDFLDEIEKRDRATDLIRTAVEKAPENLSLRSSLANRLRQEGDAEGAEAVLVEAAETFGSAAAWNLLAVYYRRDQRRREGARRPRKGHRAHGRRGRRTPLHPGRRARRPRAVRPGRRGREVPR